MFGQRKAKFKTFADPKYCLIKRLFKKAVFDTSFMASYLFIASPFLVSLAERSLMKKNG